MSYRLRRRVALQLAAAAILGVVAGYSDRADLAFAAPTPTAVAYLQDHLGLTDRQARGALGALLVYAEQHLVKSDFDALTQSVPNAASIMQAVKLQGIVTGPLDDIDEYEKTLSSLGIGQPLAAKVAPAVMDYLGATGHDLERNILSGLL
jgi:hypothetical protein